MFSPALSPNISETNSRWYFFFIAVENIDDQLLIFRLTSDSLIQN
jgi:hypothetical protein